MPSSQFRHAYFGRTVTMTRKLRRHDVQTFATVFADTHHLAVIRTEHFVLSGSIISLDARQVASGRCPRLRCAAGRLGAGWCSKVRSARSGLPRLWPTAPFEVLERQLAGVDAQLLRLLAVYDQPPQLAD